MTVTVFLKINELTNSRVGEGTDTFVALVGHVVRHLEAAKLRWFVRVGARAEDFDVGGGTLVDRELLVVHGV